MDPIPNKVIRRRILHDIEKEREWQENAYSVEHDKQHKIEEWIPLIHKQLEEMIHQSKSTGKYYKFRRQLIRVAALAVAACEIEDQKEKEL